MTDSLLPQGVFLPESEPGPPLGGGDLIPMPPDGPVWGNWRFVPENLTLTWKGWYEVDLEAINTAGAMLDWIFHCNGNRDVLDLIAAFDAVLKPQANCCSFGSQRPFSGSKLAKEYRDRKFPKRKPMGQKLRYSILMRDGFRCCACGVTAADGAVLHVDHIKAVSKGGSNDPANLQTLCFDCNIGKGAR